MSLQHLADASAYSRLALSQLRPFPTNPATRPEQFAPAGKESV